MIKVTEKFTSKFNYQNNAEGNALSLCVEKTQKCGFYGYYVTAECDTPLNAESALLLRAECTDMPFTAIYSHSLYWVQPHFGNRASEIPAKTAAVIFKNPEGDYT